MSSEVEVPEMTQSQKRMGGMNATRGNIFTIAAEDLDKILPSPDHLRARGGAPSQPAIEEMGMSLGTKGQRQPIALRKNHEDRMVVVYGNHRLAGALWWNARCAKVGGNVIGLEATVIRDCNEERALELAIAENEVRNPPTAIDHAHNIQMWRERFKKTDTQIAEKYGKTVKWVTDMSALNKLPESIQEKIHQAEIPVSAAQELVDVEPELHEEVLEEAKKQQKPGGKMEGRVTAAAVKAVKDKHGLGKKGRGKVAARKSSGEAVSVGAGSKPEGKADTTPKKTRTFKDIVAYLNTKKMPGSIHLLRWIEGKISDRELDAAV